MATEMLDVLQRWLPVPRYRFVGGPYHGQTLEVDLYEGGRGFMPPPICNLVEPFALPPVSHKPSPEPMEAVVRKVSYRFVPRGRHLNQGHYEFIPA